MSENRLIKDDFFADLEKLAKEIEEEKKNSITKPHVSLTNNKGSNGV